MADTHWKYLICDHGSPEWAAFPGLHAEWPEDIDSNRDFHAAREVAEGIAKDRDLDGDATILLENIVGERWEVDLIREEVVRYRSEDSRHLGNRWRPAPINEATRASAKETEAMTDSERIRQIATWVATWRQGGEPELCLEQIDHLSRPSADEPSAAGTSDALSPPGK